MVQTRINSLAQSEWTNEINLLNFQIWEFELRATRYCTLWEYAMTVFRIFTHYQKAFGFVGVIKLCTLADCRDLVLYISEIDQSINIILDYVLTQCRAFAIKLEKSYHGCILWLGLTSSRKRSWIIANKKNLLQFTDLTCQYGLYFNSTFGVILQFLNIANSAWILMITNWLPLDRIRIYSITVNPATSDNYQFHHGRIKRVSRPEIGTGNRWSQSGLWAWKYTNILKITCIWQVFVYFFIR